MKDKKISKFFSLTFSIFQAYLISILITFLIFYICFLLKIRVDKFGSLVFLILALGICFIISTIITHFMTKKYKKVMNETSNCFKKLSHGDFSQKIEVDTKSKNVADVIKLLDPDKIIDINISNMPLENIISEIYKNEDQ